MSLPDVFCLSQCKQMIVFFMFGVVAYEQKFLHEFVNGFSMRKVAVASLLFVAVQYAEMANGGG